MQDNIENGYKTNEKSLEEKLTVVSAAAVNLKKAEEYRKDRQQRQNINRRGWKRFALLVMLAAILGIGAAAVQLGIHWFYARSGQEPDGVVTSCWKGLKNWNIGAMIHQELPLLVPKD